VRNPEGRSLGRPRHRWESNIKINHREVRGRMDRIYLTQDKDQWRSFVNTVMKLGVL
jgi:hypothetical protein